MTGTTPLDPDEAEGLIPTWVLTRADQDVAEQEGILEAQAWLSSRRRSVSWLLDERTCRIVHRRMFGSVWRWAGVYRKSDKNIGIPWPDVPRAVIDLMADVQAWVAHGRDGRELLAEFHHRLVWIHPFPNGNGRHGRLYTEALALALSHPLPAWGVGVGADADVGRAEYIAALRSVDAGDLQPLIAVMFPATITQ